jgi:hypothetical protein
LPSTLPFASRVGFLATFPAISLTLPFTWCHVPSALSWLLDFTVNLLCESAVLRKTLFFNTVRSEFLLDQLPDIGLNIIFQDIRHLSLLSYFF